MDFTFKDSEIVKFSDKVKYIPEWFKQFFYRIHKKDKSSEYYKGCFATLRFILKFRNSNDKDRVIFYSLPCISSMIIEKQKQENDINDDEILEEMFKDLVLNVNYVYKGDENIESMDLNEMFKNMEAGFSKQKKMNNKKTDNEQKNNKKIENNVDNQQKSEKKNENKNIEIIDVDNQQNIENKNIETIDVDNQQNIENKNIETIEIDVDN